MLKKLLVALSVGAIIMVSGCGGGDGDGLDGRLVGTWLPVAATMDGNTVAPGVALDWDAGIVRQELQFNADGTVAIRYYTPDPQPTSAGMVDTAFVLDNTETGEWTAQGGSGSITINSEKSQFTYTVSGYVAQIGVTEDGHDLEITWVKSVNLTGHDSQLSKAWSVSSVEVNGTTQTPEEYFGFDPPVTTASLQFLANGLYVMRGLDNEDEIQVNEIGSWATGGGTLQVADGDEIRGIYTVGSASATVLDDSGDSAKLQLQQWATMQQHAAALVGAWEATSVTVNGSSVDMATFFGWDPNADRMTVELWQDGALESIEWDGTSPVYGSFGEWGTAAGNALTLVIGGGTESGTYTVVGNTLTVEMTEGGDDVVIAFTRTTSPYQP